MPNVNPNSSSPPKSGNVEDARCLQMVIVQKQGITSPSVTLGETRFEDTCDQIRILPPGGIPKGPAVLKDAKALEVNDTPVEISPENPNILDEASEGQRKSREQVVKEISISTTAFIGPVCQPQAKLEEELSEFYKELEEIDSQDTADGDAVDTKDISQSSAPAPYPPPGKWAKGNEHKNAYRPYPAPGSYGWHQQEHRDGRRWEPQSQNATWNGSDPYVNQNPWQCPPPRWVPQDPSRFHFHGPQRFTQLPPGIPTYPLYFEPRGNDFSRADNSSWGSWEASQSPAGYDVGFTSSHHPGTYDQYERNQSEWQRYEEQNYHDEGRYQRHNEGSLVLVLMRGMPGSGKSTLAKEILSSGPSGLILSTDDYFFQKEGYLFDPTLLGDAHDWNQMRAREAMLEGRTPVVIDNTNVQAWEMKPYVAMALEIGYGVDFVEPETSWKWDPAQLEKRNNHGVPRETIAKMLDRFELPISVDIVMNSYEPPHKRKEHVSKPRKHKPFDYR